MKKIISVLTAVVMIFSVSACGAKNTTTTPPPAEKQKLVMGTNAEFPPYEYYEGDKIVGIDAEMAEAVANYLDMELVIEDMAFGSIITAVESGQIDIGVAGMTVTEDRLVNVNFSNTYATASQVIIVPEGSAIAAPADLADKSIGVQESTTGDIYVSDEFPDADVQRYNKGVEAVQALIQGKVDAVVIDNEPAKVFIEQNEGLVILDEAYTTEEYAIAINKDNAELLEKINGALAALEADGTLKGIIDKYITAE